MLSDRALLGWCYQILLSVAAPEVLAQQPYGKEVDCWSIGVISYILWVVAAVVWNDGKNIKIKLG